MCIHSRSTRKKQQENLRNTGKKDENFFALTEFGIISKEKSKMSDVLKLRTDYIY